MYIMENLKSEEIPSLKYISLLIMKAGNLTGTKRLGCLAYMYILI